MGFLDFNRVFVFIGYVFNMFYDNLKLCVGLNGFGSIFRYVMVFVMVYVDFEEFWFFCSVCFIIDFLDNGYGKYMVYFFFCVGFSFCFLLYFFFCCIFYGLN